MTREEVYDFFLFLSREATGVSSETLPRILAEYHLQHILVEPIDYRAFTFADEQAKKEGSDEYLLERYIKALLSGELPADGVQAVVENVEPGTLALLVNQDGGEVAQAASYDTVVSSYLRSGSGKPVTGGDLQRLMTFIAGLRPELKQQFLASSVKSFSRDPQALNQALERVSVDSIIEFITEIDRAHVSMPGDLGTLIARFARTGVELPGGGLNVDDVLLSPEVTSLFRQDEAHRHGPQSYEEEIQRIVEEQAAVSGPDGTEVAHELKEEYVRYCYANALLALLDSLLPGLTSIEDEEAYAATFTALAKQSAGSGQYAQLLEMLDRFEELARRASHHDAARTVRDYYRDPAFISSIVDSFRRYGRANREAAALICAFYGREIVPPLFDLLAREERMSLRRLLLQLLIGLGEETVREAPRHLQDPRWHMRRNTLYLVAECRGRMDSVLLEPLMSDADPRVRLECARCLLLAGDAAGVQVLRALLHEPSVGVADAAIAMAGSCRVEELLPDLMALARHPTGGDGIRQRLRVVRALGQFGGAQAAAALGALLQLRISFFPGENKRFRSEVRKMLKRVAARQTAGGAAGGAAGETPPAAAR